MCNLKSKLALSSGNFIYLKCFANERKYLYGISSIIFGKDREFYKNCYFFYSFGFKQEAALKLSKNAVIEECVLYILTLACTKNVSLSVY